MDSLTGTTNTAKTETPAVFVVRFPTLDSWNAFVAEQIASGNSNFPRLRYCKYGCGGAGYFRHPKIIGKVIACPCQREQQIERDSENAETYRNTLSSIEQNFTLKNWIGSDQNALNTARRAAAQGWGMYAFWGEYGRAKSGLLAGIVNDCIDRKIPAAYKSVPKMLRELRATFESGTFDEAFNALCTIKVLALDEMWRYKETPWTAERMFDLVEERYRYADRLLTVFATNDRPNPENDAIWSRLTDARRCEIVQVAGENVRPLA